MNWYGHVVRRLRESPLRLLAKFDCHRPCSSRDIKYLICHMTLQDHVKKGSCDFIEGISWVYKTNLPSLAIVIMIIKTWHIYLSPEFTGPPGVLILWKEAPHCMVEAPHWSSSLCQFGGRRFCRSGDMFLRDNMFKEMCDENILICC